MSKTLAILGSSHLGQQIAHLAVSDNHYDEVVFFDDYTKSEGENSNKVIGSSSDLLRQYKNQKFDEMLIGIGYKHLAAKANIYKRFKNLIPFGKIIHSSCWVDNTAKIGSGVIIYPGCTIDSNVVIESNCIINLHNCIAHDSIIGESSFLAPRVVVSGFSSVGKKCFLGVGATLIDNISIADDVKVGAGAVVTKSLTYAGLYYGVPAKLVV